MPTAARLEAEGPDGPERKGAAPGSLRTCIVTRQARPPEDMIRFVLHPDGMVVPDIRRRLPGRGVWVTASSECVAKAAGSRGFSRGFKTTATAAPTLAADVDRLLEQDALQALSFANKAGLLTAGAAKVEAAIARESLAAIIQARDGTADGARKLRQALRRRFGETAGRVPWIDLFERDRLDLALGRSNVIHAALKTGPAAAAFVAHCLRLSQYRGALEPDGSKETRASPEFVFDDPDEAQAD